MATRTCKNCQNSFEIADSRLREKNKNRGKYCSNACKLAYQKMENHPRWEGKTFIRECLNCGGEFMVREVNIKRGWGRFCSNKCAKTGLFHPFYGEKRGKTYCQKVSGSNNWKWVEDRTKLKKSEKKHLDSRYKEWMRAVKNRDGWKCRISNSDCSGRLEAHHILNWVDNPELRYQINNGITLCQAHHPRGRAEEKRLVPTFKELVTVSRG